MQIHEKKFRAHEIPTRKSLGPIKYPRETWLPGPLFEPSPKNFLIFSYILENENHKKIIYILRNKSSKKLVILQKMELLTPTSKK